MRINTFILVFLLLIGFSATVATAATTTIDSLQVALKKTSDNKARVALYLALGREFQSSNPDTALLFFEKAIAISQESPKDTVWENIQSSALQELGNTNNMLNKLERADSCFKLAIELNRKLNNEVELAKNLNSIGVNRYSSGQYEQAMDWLIESVKVLQKIGDKKGEANTLRQIGIIFLGMGNHDKADEYTSNSLKIYEQLNNMLGMSKCYNNLGIIHYERSQMDKKNDEKNQLDIALSYHLKSFAINQKLGIKAELVRNYTNISNVYSLQGLVLKSLDYNQKALALYEELGNKTNLVIGYANMAGANITLADSTHGNIPLRNEYLHKAIEYEHKALKISKELKATYYTAGISESLKNIYKRLGQYEKALEYAELFVQYKDSLLNEEKIKSTTEMSTKYETAQKEQQLKMQEIQMQNERLLRNFLIVGLLILSVLAFYVFRNYKNKQKANRLLQEQKDEILAQAQQLELQNTKLNQLIQFKQGMTSMIVHDLKNPLNTIINTPTTMIDERKLETIRQSGKQMLNQVLNILDVDKYENTKMMVDFQSLSLFHCCSSAIQQVSLLIVQKNISVLNRISEGVFVNADPEILERVFINLLTNAIKFTPNNGTITLSYSNPDENRSMVKVFVSDTGTGISPEDTHLVFEKFKQLSARNSGNVRSTGLGLTYCKMAVEALGGTIEVKSKLNEGSTFGFTLPLATADLADKRSPQSDAGVTTHSLVLTPADIDYLRIFEADFGGLEFYEASAVTNALEKIDASVSPGIKMWKSKLEDAVFVCNEQQYTELIQSIFSYGE